MKSRTIILATFLAIIFASFSSNNDEWISKTRKGYRIFYNPLDNQNIDEYDIYFMNGRKIVCDFFKGAFRSDYDIYVHPNRASLDKSWQKDWNIPDFKSQCWMVASGVANKLDLISPMLWDSLACEHQYSNSVKTQRLITHELVHVFHGQNNESPDFSNINGIDWFVEGLAVYASGQCDSIRIAEVKNAVLINEIPNGLTNFWSGALRYGLSGTVVMYLDNKYGRKKLIEQLKYNDIERILKSLETTETDIVEGWEEFLAKL